MPEISLPFEFTPIPIEYIENAKANGETLGENPDLKGIWNVIMLARGWGGAVEQPVLANLIYENAPTEPRKGRVPAKTKSEGNPLRRTKGARIFEQVLTGKRPISLKEAQAFHLAFGAAFGDAWAKAIPKEQLVLLSLAELFHKFTEQKLPWPTAIGATEGLHMLALMLEDEELFFAPAFSDVERAGVRVDGPNEHLMAVKDVPRHSPGDKYHLVMDGLDADRELCAVFELSLDGLSNSDGAELVNILPVGLRRAGGDEEIFQTVENGDYVISEAKGRFVFVAIALPYTKALENSLSALKQEEGLSVAQGIELGHVLRGTALSDPSKVRSAVYEYFVA